MAKAAHGRSHSPESEDAIYTGKWHYVGETGEPAFENGWVNQGGTTVPMRFRIAVGRPNVLDETGAIVYYCDKQLDFQGDVVGGADGTTVFTLPNEFRLDYDTPLDAHDDLGVHVPCRVYADGSFVRGIP